jgi:hypothetical protein
MNSNHYDPLLNSKNIIQLAYDYFQLKMENKDTFSFYELPNGITKEMLYQELKCADLNAYYETVTVEYLWKQYVYIHTSFNNKFGFKRLPTDIAFQEQRNLFKFNNNTNSVKIFPKYPKKTIKRAKSLGKRATTVKRVSKSKSRSKSKVEPITKSKSKTKSKTMTYPEQRGGGFNGNVQNLRNVIQNINNSALPSWHGRFSKFVKIKDIGGKKIYLHASSIPLPNIINTGISELSQLRNQHCSNLLNFYRFIMDIPKIISLQGCDLNWDFLPYSYDPESCVGVNELTTWRETCSRYDGVDSDPRSNMMEFHWVDMDPGYFNVYDNLSKIDFTNKMNNSIIHCLAGYGRTGVVILLTICVNYYRVNKNKFNSDFFVKSSKPGSFKSMNMINHLKKLLTDFTEKDTDIPGDFTEADKNNPIGLNISNTRVNDIKYNINRFDISLIKEEVFLYNFHSNYGYHVSYTHVIVFITRINYIIYFTALRNGMKQFPLFHIKPTSYYETLKVIRSETDLFDILLSEPVIYTHEEVEKIMNDADKFGFDLQELPIVDGFDFKLLSDLEDTSSSSRCSIS